MYPGIEPTLFTDAQTQLQIARCHLCGGTCYAPGYRCLRCERSAS